MPVPPRRYGGPRLILLRYLTRGSARGEPASQGYPRFPDNLRNFDSPRALPRPRHGVSASYFLLKFSHLLRGEPHLSRLLEEYDGMLSHLCTLPTDTDGISQTDGLPLPHRAKA